MTIRQHRTMQRLGLTLDEVKRRCHGAIDDRQMVALVLALEAELQRQERT